MECRPHALCTSWSAFQFKTRSENGVCCCGLCPCLYFGENYLIGFMLNINWFPIKIPIQVVEACGPPPPHTFQCNQYDSWDPSPWTYTVPVGDFCSSENLLPGKPDCAKNVRRDAPRISIFDGEGTDCMIEMYNSPGTLHTSFYIWEASLSLNGLLTFCEFSRT